MVGYTECVQQILEQRILEIYSDTDIILSPNLLSNAFLCVCGEGGGFEHVSHSSVNRVKRLENVSATFLSKMADVKNEDQLSNFYWPPC